MAHFNKIFPTILIILYIIYFSMIQLIYSLFYMKKQQRKMSRV